MAVGTGAVGVNKQIKACRNRQLCVRFAVKSHSSLFALISAVLRDECDSIQTDDYATCDGQGLVRLLGLLVPVVVDGFRCSFNK